MHGTRKINLSRPVQHMTPDYASSCLLLWSNKPYEHENRKRDKKPDIIYCQCLLNLIQIFWLGFYIVVVVI